MVKVALLVVTVCALISSCILAEGLPLRRTRIVKKTPTDHLQMVTVPPARRKRFSLFKGDQRQGRSQRLVSSLLKS
ncbi:unnamed protein product [Haemonchus placei]|uniref:Secreted protein n=1 Tax=Haemonchus placei TaxID=6290 RepID=A0A0N4WMS1_HAEPC|nr:unnamed protein product [Haemonchus placei]